MQTTTTKQFYIGFMGPAAFQDAALSVLPALEDRLNAAVDLDQLVVPFRQLYLTIELVEEEEHLPPQTNLERGELEVRVKVPTEGLPVKEQAFKTVLFEHVAKALQTVEAMPEVIISLLRR